MPASYDIYREQVAYLARQTPFNTAVTGGIALFTAAIIWHSAPDLWLFLWLIAHIALTGIAYIRWRKGLSRNRWAAAGAGEAHEKSRRRFVPLAAGWAAMSGAVWGSAAFFLPELPPIEQFALMIVMACMASGASSTLAAVPLAAAGFILADLIPVIIYFFLQGTFVYSALGAMAAIFTLALLSSTRIVYGIFLEASRNRRENAALLEQIREERKAAAESLMRSEERYSDVVKTVGDMIVSTEAEGAFLFTNPAWRNTLGYSEADLSTKTFRGILHETWLPQSIERIRSVLAQETDVPVELVLKTRDGQPVWVEGKISPLFENGRLVRINGVFRNIGLRKEAERMQLELQARLEQRVVEATRDLAEINTSLQQEVSERRQAEQAWRNSEAQLRLILDSTVEAIYGVDRNGRCTFANTACARLLGFEEASELLGANMHLLTHAQLTDASIEDCPVCKVHMTETRAQADDLKFTRRGGGVFPVEYSAGSIMRDGRVVGGVVAFLDITRRLKAEDQLRQAQKMEAIGQLTGGIAHDFNNLLAIIIGNLDLLASTCGEIPAPFSLAVQKRTDTALHAAERASALTQRLLTFARKKILSPQIIDPGRMVAEMSEILCRTLGDDVTINIKIADPVWRVVIDLSQFENALLNLSINARDAMKGAGVLTIEMANISFSEPRLLPRLAIPEGDYVKLCVRDTGSGMPEEILDRVFEPFFTTKDAGQGTGLGLSMVFGFVEQSRGYIHLESAPESGTAVTLYLPRAAAGEEEEARGRDAPPLYRAEAPSRIAPEDICILVVEDDPGVRQSSVAQIEELGYKVLSAEDGPGALALFTKTPGINLVYSDIMMPNGLNGPELARRILALNPEIKVVLCTGYEGGAEASDMSHAHNIKVLQKPVRKALLAATLRETLNA